MKIFEKKLSEKTIFEKILKKWKTNFEKKFRRKNLKKKLRNEKFWKKIFDIF